MRATGHTRKWSGLRVGVGFAIVFLTVTAIEAQTFSSGSTGADGPFDPACTPTPCTVQVALTPSGVFNFTTVNISAGVTVRFIPNAANTPVTILATGDVTIVGTIDLNADLEFVHGPSPGRGGPGGFEGGLGGGGGATLSRDGTPGLGPGGGGGGRASDGTSATAGSFSSTGTGPLPGPTYGVSTLFPLIGGSGGGGGAATASSQGAGGGGGGGAILIASSGVITLGIPDPLTDGIITATGGRSAITPNGTTELLCGGAGSGGAVRLVANRLTGRGSIGAQAGGGSGCLVNNGGAGRIRLESFENTLFLVNPLISAGPNPTPSLGLPGPVAPPAALPTLKIAAVGGIAAPSTPQGTFLATPDIALGSSLTNPVTVNLEATNVPPGTIVALTVVTEGVATPTTVNSAPLVGTLASSTATADVTLPPGTSVIAAFATFAASTASLGTPLMIGGEEVKWVRVGSSTGRRSSVTYVTASGREVAVH